MKESAKIGGNKVHKGVEDLDFFIGDEAQEKPNYSVKVGTIVRIQIKNLKYHLTSILILVIVASQKWKQNVVW